MFTQVSGKNLIRVKPICGEGELIEMNRRTFPLIILVSLTLSLIAAMPVNAEVKPIVVAHSKGALEPDLQLKALTNLTYIEWRVVLGDLTPADLSGADMLIMSKSDSAAEYTADELNAIASWFSQGGKTLWVAADSDYGTDHLRQYTCNAVLEKVGSKLRIDDCSAEDATSNAAAGYRVLGVSANVDPMFGFIVTGVERALFHGPGVVAGLDNGVWVDLSKDTIENVYVIMTTSDDGLVVDNSEPAPNVMEAGAEGNFPLMVFQVDWAKKNLIIATGESPYDQYEGMYLPELRNPGRYGPTGSWQQGAVLMENILRYATVFGDEIMGLQTNVWGKETTITGLTADKTSLQGQVSTLTTEKGQLQADLMAAQSSASTMQLVAVAALVVGVVVGYFVGPMIKKQ